MLWQRKICKFSHRKIFVTHVHLGFKLYILMPEDARWLPKQNAVLDFINIIFVFDSKFTTYLYFFKYKQYFIHRMYLCTAFYISRSNLSILKAVKLRAEQNFRTYIELFYISQNCQFLQNVYIFLRCKTLPHQTLDPRTKWRWCRSA